MGCRCTLLDDDTLEHRAAFELVVPLPTAADKTERASVLSADQALSGIQRFVSGASLLASLQHLPLLLWTPTACHRFEVRVGSMRRSHD